MNPPGQQGGLGLGQSGLSFRELFANSTLYCIPNSRRTLISGLRFDVKSGLCLNYNLSSNANKQQH